MVAYSSIILIPKLYTSVVRKYEKGGKNHLYIIPNINKINKIIVLERSLDCKRF